jgi:hypothetical protein
MNANKPDIPGPDGTQESLSDEIAAWEEIAPGRFMPRRVRGSCHGRALG